MPIHDSDRLDKLREQLHSLQSELSALQRERQMFEFNSAVGFYGTGVAQMVDGGSEVFLNVGGILYGGVHQKIQEYSQIVKNAAVKVSEGDHLGVVIDQSLGVLEKKFKEEVLVLKTIINVSEQDKDNTQKVLDLASDLGTYIESRGVEAAASIASGAKKMKDGYKTIGEGKEYREKMETYFEQRKSEIESKISILKSRMGGVGSRSTELRTSGKIPDFQPVLTSISRSVDQLIENIP
jgi:hypothetical protein